MRPTYTFRAKLWLYSGEGAWYFVTLPQEYADEIKSFTLELHTRGFGSVKVDASIQDVSWSTSVFPDKKSKSYVMPIKKDIRTRLNIREGDDLEVTIQISNG